jgi:hypothetical protein
VKEYVNNVELKFGGEKGVRAECMQENRWKKSTENKKSTLSRATQDIEYRQEEAK